MSDTKPRDCPKTHALLDKIANDVLRARFETPSPRPVAPILTEYLFSEETSRALAEAVAADTQDDSIAEACRLIKEYNRIADTPMHHIRIYGDISWSFYSHDINLLRTGYGEIIPTLRRLVAEAQPTAADLFDRAEMAANVAGIGAIVEYFQALKREREAKR